MLAFKKYKQSPVIVSRDGQILAVPAGGYAPGQAAISPKNTEGRDSAPRPSVFSQEH
jgi:hypothetical protein